MLPTATFFRHHPLLLCSLFFLALLYTFFYRFFTFLLASSPVLLLTAFLLGVVLVYSDPNLPPEDDHVYKKTSQVHCHSAAAATTTTTGRQHFHHGSDSAASSDSDNPLAMSTATSHTSFPYGGDESRSESEPECPEEKQGPEEEVRVVAWTAEDDKSIENIGSLELERNAAVEKVMSRRQRHHTDTSKQLSIHITGSSRKNPFDLDGDDFPGSAPSMILASRSRNPFFFDDDSSSNNNNKDTPSSSSQAPRNTGMMFRRHESFTVGAPFASDFRSSRFRPYFVTEKMQDQPVAIPQASGKSNSSSSSSSTAGAGAASTSKEEEEEEEEEEATTAMLEVKTNEGGMVVAVDVELISDSSDDDMSLPAGDDEQMKQQQQQQHKVAMSDEEDDGESFEVESITKQVAAAAASKGNQLDADPAYDYSPSSAGKMEKQEQAFDQAQAGAGDAYVAVPAIHDKESTSISASGSSSGGSFAGTNKLASMRRVFHDQDEIEDGVWVAPSKPASVEEETREHDVLAPLPPLAPAAAPSVAAATAAPSVAAATAAPSPLAAASLREKTKSSRYKPPSKKAVLGFFRK